MLDKLNPKDWVYLARDTLESSETSHNDACAPSRAHDWNRLQLSNHHDPRRTHRCHTRERKLFADQALLYVFSSQFGRRWNRTTRHIGSGFTARHRPSLSYWRLPHFSRGWNRTICLQVMNLECTHYTSLLCFRERLAFSEERSICSLLQAFVDPVCLGY
jgi:hypothetical protein